MTVAPDELEAVAFMLDGTLERVGAVVSRTVTSKVWALDSLFDASVALQLTVVVPSAKVVPEAGVQFMAGFGSTASCALIWLAKLTVAPLALVASTDMGLLGTVSCGAVVSLTVTVKLPLSERPPESVTEQLTVVVPTGKVLPEAGAH